MNLKAKELIADVDDIIESPRVNELRNWLSQAEVDRAATIPCLNVRHRWLAGRWLAKQAVTEIAGNESIPKTTLHIESRDACDRGAPPRIYLDGRLTRMQLSISHAGNSVAAAVLNDSRARVGIDVMACHAIPGAGAMRHLLLAVVAAAATTICIARRGGPGLAIVEACDQRGNG